MMWKLNGLDKGRSTAYSNKIKSSFSLLLLEKVPKADEAGEREGDRGLRWL